MMLRSSLREVLDLLCNVFLLNSSLEESRVLLRR